MGGAGRVKGFGAQRARKGLDHGRGEGLENPTCLWRLFVSFAAQAAAHESGANRYVRDLTCQERNLYGIEPRCDE
jgi:hypothetical protein